MVYLTLRLLPTQLSPSLRNLEVPIPEASRSTLYAQFLCVFNRLHRSGVQLRTVIFGLKHVTEVSALILLSVMLMSRYWNLVHALNDTNISV